MDEQILGTHDYFYQEVPIIQNGDLKIHVTSNKEKQII